MNYAFLIGNIVNEPELKYITGLEPIATCRFRIAVNEGYGDKRKTDYITIQTWRKTAENVDKFCHKGSKVAVVGKIQTGSYEKRDGTKAYTFEVVANSVEFLNSKGGGQESQRAEVPAEAPSGFEQVDVDDCPF